MDFISQQRKTMAFLLSSYIYFHTPNTCFMNICFQPFHFNIPFNLHNFLIYTFSPLDYHSLAGTTAFNQVHYFWWVHSFLFRLLVHAPNIQEKKKGIKQDLGVRIKATHLSWIKGTAITSNTLSHAWSIYHINSFSFKSASTIHVVIIDHLYVGFLQLYTLHSFKICPRNITVFEAIFSQMVHTGPQVIWPDNIAQSFLCRLHSPLHLPVASVWMTVPLIISALRCNVSFFLLWVPLLSLP